MDSSPVAARRPNRLRRVAVRILAAYGAFLALLLYTPVTEWVAQPLYLPPSPPRPADAVVVLEAWASEDGELNESGLRRALRGAELYRRGTAPRVVLTGLRATPSRPGSALQPMAKVLTDTGVPCDAILIEDMSEDTHESAVHVAALARANGWTRLLLVTDATHCLRAELSFRKEGFDVDRAPTLMWALGGAQPSLRLARIATLAHEYGALAVYRARGWI